LCVLDNGVMQSSWLSFELIGKLMRDKVTRRKSFIHWKPIMSRSTMGIKKSHVENGYPLTYPHLFNTYINQSFPSLSLHTRCSDIWGTLAFTIRHG
jgi:hypothetical protein